MESVEPVTCASAGNPTKTYRQASKPTANKHSASTVIQPLVCLCTLLAGSLSILPPELVRPRSRRSRWTSTAARQRRLPHYQSPDYALKYLQLRAASQSHFRNRVLPFHDKRQRKSVDRELHLLSRDGNGCGQVEGDDGFRRHRNIFVAGKGAGGCSPAGSQQATN